MRRSLLGGLLVTTVLAWSATESAAQETGTPMFKAPYRAFTQYEFGASLSDPGEGVSLAVEGFYNYGNGPHDFGFRAGFADPEGTGDAIFLVGANFRTRVLSYSAPVSNDAVSLQFSQRIGANDALCTGTYAKTLTFTLSTTQP